MHPELIPIPFLNLTIQSYGTMMVTGFLVAVFVMRRMMVKQGENPERIMNCALYALLAGVVGARVFFVIHYHEQFVGDWLSVFAVWKGGLELLGGVIAGIGFLVGYLHVKKLRIALYLDILAIGLLIGIGFGRIGCFLNGCCYGRVTDLPVGVCFPYGSPAYHSQVHPDMARDREKPLLDLPAEYFGYRDADGNWITLEEDTKHLGYLRPKELLTEQQRHDVTEGPYRCLPVHPTQLYSSGINLCWAGLLFMFWTFFGHKKQGTTMSLMLILYSIGRFIIEGIRDDNPFESAWWVIYKGGTISQNISIYMIVAGIVCLVLFMRKNTVRDS